MAKSKNTATSADSAPEEEVVSNPEEAPPAYVVPEEYGTPLKYELEIYHPQGRGEYVVRVVHPDTDRVDTMTAADGHLATNFGHFIEFMIQSNKGF